MPNVAMVSLWAWAFLLALAVAGEGKEKPGDCERIVLAYLPAPIYIYEGIYSIGNDVDGRPSWNGPMEAKLYWNDTSKAWLLEHRSAVILRSTEDVSDPKKMRAWSSEFVSGAEDAVSVGVFCADCNFGPNQLEDHSNFNQVSLFEPDKTNYNGYRVGKYDLPLTEEGIWKWAGTFDVHPGTYWWSFNREMGCYFVPTLTLLMVLVEGTSCPDRSNSLYQSFKPEGIKAWDQVSATSIASGQPILLKQKTTLIFDQNTYDSQHPVTIPASGCLITLTGTHPGHLLASFRSKFGVNNFPKWHTSMVSIEYLKDWGVFPEALLAVLVSSLPTLLGILMLFPVFKKFNALAPIFNAFAGGVLLGTALLHLYPEGLTMLETHDPIELLWQSGTATMVGILICFFMDVIFPEHGHDHAQGEHHSNHETEVQITRSTNIFTADSGSEDADVDDPKDVHVGEITALKHEVEEPRPEVKLPKAKKLEVKEQETTVASQRSFFDFRGIKSTAWNLCLGDACHNVTDGVMIGASFLSCDSQMGWIICGAMLAHEIPQEIGDFFLLIGAGMSIPQALFFNFLSGLAAVGGLLVVYTIDITPTILGILLLMGAGVFIYISLCMLMPTILSNHNSNQKYIQVVAFLSGILVLGSTLAAHTHCQGAQGSVLDMVEN